MTERWRDGYQAFLRIALAFFWSYVVCLKAVDVAPIRSPGDPAALHWAAIVLEAGIVALLVSPAWRRGVQLSFLVALAFGAWLFAGRLLFGDPSHCGCFGAARVSTDVRMALLIVVQLLSMASIYIGFEESRRST